MKSKLDSLLKEHRGDTSMNNTSSTNVGLARLLNNDYTKPKELKTVYVDKDIHEILNRLKAATGHKMSHITTFIFHEFIQNNENELKSILTKKNKFLEL